MQTVKLLRFLSSSLQWKEAAKTVLSSLIWKHLLRRGVTTCSITTANKRMFPIWLKQELRASLFLPWALSWNKACILWALPQQMQYGRRWTGGVSLFPGQYLCEIETTKLHFIGSGTQQSCFYHSKVQPSTVLISSLKEMTLFIFPQFYYKNQHFICYNSAYCNNQKGNLYKLFLHSL